MHCYGPDKVCCTSPNSLDMVKSQRFIYGTAFGQESVCKILFILFMTIYFAEILFRNRTLCCVFL